MISYELAKKLKGAGFPQEGKGEFGADKEETCEGCGFHTLYYPTFLELIKGCIKKAGISHFRLRLLPSGSWTADFDDDFQHLGNNPEEAVANLWLALEDKEEK